MFGEPAGKQQVRAERYSLITCDTFEVVFDCTPRPHFIILSQDNSKRDYDSLASVARPKVIKVAKEMVSRYNLQKSAILSLHFGSWIDTDEYFHAHICVDVDDYLRIFYEGKKRIPPTLLHTGTFSSGYEGKVRKYAPTYYEKDLKAVIEHRGSVSGPNGASTSADITLPPRIIAHNQRTVAVHLYYHLSQPRVGFAVDKSVMPISEELLLENMIEFAKENGLTVKGLDGCHVCLFLDGKARVADVSPTETHVGYIQVSGLKFYKDLCPKRLREEWFNEWKDDYIIHT